MKELNQINGWIIKA